MHFSRTATFQFIMHFQELQLEFDLQTFLHIMQEVFLKYLLKYFLTLIRKNKTTYFIEKTYFPICMHFLGLPDYWFTNIFVRYAISLANVITLSFLPQESIHKPPKARSWTHPGPSLRANSKHTPQPCPVSNHSTNPGICHPSNGWCPATKNILNAGLFSRVFLFQMIS